MMHDFTLIPGAAADFTLIPGAADQYRLIPGSDSDFDLLPSEAPQFTLVYDERVLVVYPERNSWLSSLKHLFSVYFFSERRTVL